MSSVCEPVLISFPCSGSSASGGSTLKNGGAQESANGSGTGSGSTIDTLPSATATKTFSDATTPPKKPAAASFAGQLESALLPIVMCASKLNKSDTVTHSSLTNKIVQMGDCAASIKPSDFAGSLAFNQSPVAGKELIASSASSFTKSPVADNVSKATSADETLPASQCAADDLSSAGAKKETALLPVVEEPSWNCQRCTFENHPAVAACECCMLGRYTEVTGKVFLRQYVYSIGLLAGQVHMWTAYMYTSLVHTV